MYTSKRHAVVAAASMASLLLFCVLVIPAQAGDPAPLFEENKFAKADRVLNLPLYGTPPSPQYSGFLNASMSTEGTFLHYWMASYEGDLKLQSQQDEADFDDGFDPEAEYNARQEEERRTKKAERKLDMFFPLDPKDVPVIFWFNGGPGSSSVLGFLSEMGPLIVKEHDGDGLMRNPFSWTRKAHLVALESPAGVGYSFCHNATLTLEPGPCHNSDKSTASDARAAVEDFFATKFPDLKENPVYLVGESYAGVYIPTLAKELLDNAPEVNLKGIAVGDPCTDNEAQRQAFDMLWYSHKYGFVPDDTYDLLYHQCRVRIPHPITLGEYHGDPEKMKEVLQRRQARLDKEQQEHRINMVMGFMTQKKEEERRHRNLLGKNMSPEDAKQQQEREKAFKAKNEESHESDAEDELHERLVEFEQVCRLEHRKFMIQSSMELSQEWAGMFVNSYGLYEPVDTSYYQESLVGYMNRVDVRAALHMEDAPVSRWYDDTPYTSKNWSYHSQYDACNDNADLALDAWSMVDFYRDISPRLDKTIVFNGDSDPCVTYEGTRRAILGKVGFNVVPGGSYRPWFFHQEGVSTQVLEDRPILFGSGLTVHDAGTQFGGHVVNLEHNLSFVTVHGSGHMVPAFKPQAALQVLDELLHDRPMAPLLETDETIMNMSKHAFHKYVGNWTQNARDSV
jgi:hypothetical protein